MQFDVFWKELSATYYMAAYRSRGVHRANHQTAYPLPRGLRRFTDYLLLSEYTYVPGL